MTDKEIVDKLFEKEDSVRQAQVYSNLNFFSSLVDFETILFCKMVPYINVPWIAFNLHYIPACGGLAGEGSC